MKWKLLCDKVDLFAILSLSEEQLLSETKQIQAALRQKASLESQVSPG